MKTNEWNELKIGDRVTHKHFGLCLVHKLFMGCPVLLVLTQEGQDLLFQVTGMPSDCPVLEGNKKNIEKEKREIEI
jgi:hypothetical protein